MHGFLYSMRDPAGGRIMVMRGSAASLNVAGFAVSKSSLDQEINCNFSNYLRLIASQFTILDNK